MSLVKYLEENEIDRIEDDQEFMEAEHDAIQTYCENCGYCIVDEDLSIINPEDWKIVSQNGKKCM